MVKRINFFGVPSVGKTTVATGFFHFCKSNGHICELISELARDWAYTDRQIKSFDQIYLTASQMHREDTLLHRNKVEFVITDSPILLNAFYSDIHNSKFLEPLIDLHAIFESTFPSVNFYIRKNSNSSYSASGRHHNEAQLDELRLRMDGFLSKYIGGSLHIIENADQLAFEKLYSLCGLGS